MSSRRSSNKENVDRLSSFGQHLQSLSNTFYSTILQEEIVSIKNAQQLKDFQDNNFTFDECSISQITSNDHFSFTFHSIDQANPQIYQKHQVYFVFLQECIIQKKKFNQKRNDYSTLTKITPIKKK